MKGRPKVSYDFGEYRLIPAERLLLKNGHSIQLGSKAFDMLVVLVENAGELVDNKTMLQMVWPDSMVEEANIHVQISSLRKAIEETSNGKFIETLPRIGYRFNSDVRIINGSPLQPEPGGNNVGQPPETGAAAASIPVPSRKKSVAAVIFVLAVVAAGAGLIGVRQFLKRSAPPFDRVTISKITNTGKELMSALSPDGTNLAYIHTENNKGSIWLRNIPSGAEKKLLEPSESHIGSLVFSPSGDLIYFTKSERNERGALFELSILDGTPKKVIDNVLGRVTFSPDGSQVAFVRVNSVNSRWDVIIGNASGGGERTITSSPFVELIRYPAWSPTSRKLAAFKQNREVDDAGNRYSVVEIDADSGEIAIISKERWQTFGDIAWLKDGTGMVFTASKQLGAPEQVWYLDRGTGTAKRLTNDTDNYSRVTLDSSSGVIAAVTTTRTSGIWSTDENEDVSHLANITTGAASQEGDWGLAFGAGNKILYTANTDGKNNIWTMNPDGNERRRLTNGYYDHHPTVVPNTGNIIYVSQEPEGTCQIWTMAPDGSGKTALTQQFRIYWHNVTPDGRWLIFSGLTDMTHSHIWKMPVSGGDVIPISDKLVRSQMALSPDGKLLAFATHEDTDKLKIVMLSPDTGEMVKEFDTPPGFIPNTHFRWAHDTNAIIYKASFGPGWNLWNLPLDGGPPKQVTHFENEIIQAFNWSADGRLIISKGKVSSDVVLIRQQN